MRRYAPSIAELKEDYKNHLEVRSMFFEWFQDQRGKQTNEFRTKKASVVLEECWKELQDRIQDAIDIEDTNKYLSDPRNL